MSESRNADVGSRDLRLAVGLAPRATHWKLRTRTIEFPPRPLVVGIVNVTPDSFSDPGLFYESASAIEHAVRLATQGADLIDIGGESTRPGSQSVTADEELRRILPVVEAVCQRVSVPVSIDTSKAIVARAAVAAGCEIINDITGFEGDPQMVRAAVDSGAGLVVMHMQGTPQTMQKNPTYGDVVTEVFDYLRGRRDALMKAGIDRERICLDPGLGFGKTTEHNLALLANCGQFHELGCPLLVGPSRKKFIAELLSDDTADRTAGTIGVSCALAAQGVQVVRVHDVAAVRQALVLFAASAVQSTKSL